MRKVIITVSLTGGVQTKAANPNLPEQPDEIAKDAYDCFNEGAAIAHLHARDKEGGPTGDVEIFKEIHESIHVKCNMILQDSTGGGPGLTFEQRLDCLDAEPEMASLNMGSMLRTIGKSAGTTWANPRPELERFAREMANRNIKAEMEIYHHGMIREMRNFIDKGLLQKPYYVNFVMGMVYQGAVEATAENLTTLVQLLPPDTMFNCCSIGRSQIPITTLSVLLGGHARVGMEDNIYYSKGELAKSNAQLVAKSVRIIKDLGYEIASPEEAREILGLPKP
ncbi:3-keto-5-aminohexanoate cleavage protein [Deltaproteobacteria bacterium]|nr:3-keto-5-aminohexanoate cleavage protein [Deltaproteobacteria bacterium]